MNLNAVPAELRARRQWVVWRSVISEGAITKPPFDPNNPGRMASVTDPTTWGSFEEAVGMMEANPSLIQGIGYVFSVDDEFFGIDIDDENKVKPEHLEARRHLVSQLMAQTKTYAEVSPSGKGIHMIGRGSLPVAGKRSTAMQVEVYCSERYFTITGNVIDNRTEIEDLQDLVVAVFGAIAPNTGGQELVGDTSTNRRLDLADEEVIRLATNFNPTFAPRFNGQVGCEPGEWSDTFMAIVGMLDRFTGSVEQIARIIYASPMVLNSKPNGGETRLAKAKRTLHHTLSIVRRGNDGILHFSEHGRQIVENLNRAKAQRAQEAAEALAKAEEAIAGMSQGSQSVLDAFSQLTTEHKMLTRPPGIVGQFVASTEKATYKPFTKFAIPATLSTLSGIVSRGFKLPGGTGLNINFVLAAPSNAGKTQTMRAWERFMGEAAQIIGNGPSGPSHTRVLNSSTSSIQAVMKDFMDCPSLVWFVEECYSQLNSMNEGKSPTDAHLRDAYNQLYDAGHHGIHFSGPRSVANRKAEVEPVNNLNVSTYWTTTTSKFDVFSGDALDGFLSRVIVIRHHGPGGEPVRYVEDLNPQLRDVLVQRLAVAKQLDEAYKLSAFEAQKLITSISIEGIADLHWQFIQTTDAIANAAIEGKIPPIYGAISRLPMTALRISGMMAVMENPFTPSISEEQYKWAFGYLLQNLTSLLTDVDAGIVGDAATDEVAAVVRVLKRLLKKQKQVSRQELRNALKHTKPFNEAHTHGPGRSKRATDAIDFMIKEGMLEEIILKSEGPGRPTTYLIPVLSDTVWSS